ncbi:uncharacterized protein BKCO1_3000240 [Diplodia corticola]|uniref:Integral membrane protein n=1 Tax=Diplodia corticola TaxID=236234 RepID=A0A1J9REA6_9PEZI|nr:uncharacterized protein BKCO1_3000240 [Diplodia corticola]OJD38864.1 integral membrane protein [Diplodia corticola]
MAATYITTHLTTTSNSVATATSTIIAALAPPAGYNVDFDNPGRKGDTTGYWVFTFGVVFALLFLMMRLYTKIVVARSFVVDDVFIVASFVSGLACQGLLVYMWKNEIQGVHAWEIPLEHYNLYNLLIMCASVIYAPTQGFAKLSLLLFYRRLAPFAWFRAAIYVVMFVVIAYTLGIMFSLIFPCKPIASNWDITIEEGECINKTGIYIATAVINIATDIALLLLPVPVLARLQIPRLEKAALIAMFGVGSMTCVTSVVRLVILIPMLTDLDQTWAVSVPCVWILVEANLVVICGCLPIVRKFARHVAPKLFFHSHVAGASGPSDDPSAASSGGTSGKKRKSKGRSSRSRTAEFTFQTIGSKRSRPLVGGARKGRRGGRGGLGEDHSNIELNTTWVGDDTVVGAGDDKAESSVGDDDGRGVRRTWSDGGSETCIVETKTTVVEYGDASESMKDGFARPRGV